MKPKLLLFLTGLICAVVSQAQPTYNAADFTPQPGVALTSINCDYQDPGVSGANVTWNFSTLSNQDSNVTYFVNPSSAPDLSMYPGANYVTTNDSSYFDYLQMTSNALLQLGGLGNDGSGEIYTDPLKQMVFPFTYNTSFNDSFAATILPDSLNSNITGQISATADAWGTLITPAGSFSNVIRVHILENGTISTEILGQPFSTPLSAEAYIFLKGGYPNPILQFSTTSGFGGSNQTSGEYLTGISTGLIEHPNLALRKIKIGPNPVRDNLNAFLSLSHPSRIEFAIIDLSGKTVANLGQQSFAAGDVEKQFQIPQLSSGQYLLQMQVDGVITCEPFEVIK